MVTDNARAVLTEIAAHVIDRLVTTDISVRGLIDDLYEAAYARQGGPLCLSAARLLRRNLEGGGIAVFATGFPQGGAGFQPLPETDGPVGAALMARALLLAFGTRSVIVTDDPFMFAVEAACRGAGLAPLSLRDDMIVPEIRLRPVFTVAVPFDKDISRARTDRILDVVQPRVVVSVERPGQNSMGVWRGLNGRDVSSMTGDLDHLVCEASRRGIATLGIGDGGNEIGMGAVADRLPGIIMRARDRGFSIGTDVGAATATDVLVAALISNWGAIGVIAALALEMGRPELLHSRDIEERCLRMCADSGAVDGRFYGPEPSSDGVPVDTCGGLLELLRHTMQRGLGL
jgi:D-glutamate cyclase